MSMKVIRTGDEPEIAQAVIWLERLGITRDMIKSVNIYAEVGQPLYIQPMLMVPDPAEVTIPEPSPVQRDLCPCGAGFEHDQPGDQEQHADWIDRRPGQ